SDDGPAERGSPGYSAGRGQPEAGTRNPGRSNERCHGEEQVVSDRKSRRVSQHGDEMRGPDPIARGGAGRDQPKQPCAAHGSAGPVKEIDGGETGQKADGGSQDDQAPVVLGGEARDDAQHWALHSARRAQKLSALGFPQL